MKRDVYEMKQGKRNFKRTGHLKRSLALLLAVLMTESIMADTGSLYLRAQEKVTQEYEILGFEELSETVKEQVLPLGAKETDILFPDSLKVTVKEQISIGEENPIGEDSSLENADQKQEEEKQNNQENENSGEEKNEDLKEEQPEERDDGTEKTPEQEPEKNDSTEKEQPQKQNTATEGTQEEEQQAEKEEHTEDGIDQAAAVWDFLDAFQPMTAYAAELGETNTNSETEENFVDITLSGIEWSLNAEESQFPKFDGNKDGSVYVYTPVLPEKDEEGNTFVLSEDVELPEIYVLVGQMQLTLLSGNELDIDTLPLSYQQNYRLYKIIIDENTKSRYEGKTLTGIFTDHDGISPNQKGIVVSGTTVNLTIKDMIINKSTYDGTDPAIRLTNGACLNLTLEGTSEVYGAYGAAGICVEEGCTLRITSESTGFLKAVGGSSYGGGAGIGVNGTGTLVNQGTVQYLGTIIIEGGNIEAIGGTFRIPAGVIMSSAAIGGGYAGTTGKIYIRGGNVTAKSGDQAAAIGGGVDGRVELIEITGGKVTAISREEYKGAAIGTGYKRKMNGEQISLSCGTISITGGEIDAQGNIGYGDGDAKNLAGGSVYIGEDAKVTCTGKIEPISGEQVKYHLTFVINDGRLYRDALANKQINGKVTIDNQSCAGSYEITRVEVKIELDFFSKSFSGQKEAVVTLGDYEYRVPVDFVAEQTEYEIPVGRKLYYTTLFVYMDKCGEKPNTYQVTVSKGGKQLSLDEGEYWISPSVSGSFNAWTVHAYLPAGDDIEAAFTLDTVNGGKPLYASGQRIAENHDNKLTFVDVTADLTDEDTTDNLAQLRVAAVDGAKIYYLLSDTALTEEAFRAKVEAGDTEYVQMKWDANSPEGPSRTFTLIGERDKCTYTCYVIAEYQGAYSEVKRVSFYSDTVKSMPVMLLPEGESKGVQYISLEKAVADAQKPENTGCTVKLLEDVACQGTMEINGGEFILDLNGKTLSGIEKVDVIHLNNGCLTVQDSQSTGEIKVRANIFTVKGGTLIIEDGYYFSYSEKTVYADENADTTSQVVIKNCRGLMSGIFMKSGMLIVEGGTVNGSITALKNTRAEIRGGKCGNTYLSQENTVITGGTFSYLGVVNEETGNSAAEGGDLSKFLPEGYLYKNGKNPNGTRAENINYLVGTVTIKCDLPKLGENLSVTITGGTGANLTPMYGDTLTATTENATQEMGMLTYQWYRADEAATEKVADGVIYQVTAQDIGKKLFCEVTAEKNFQGSARSKDMGAVTKYLLNDADNEYTASIIKYYTGKEITLTGEDLVKVEVGKKKNQSLIFGKDFEITGYMDNVEVSTGQRCATAIIKGKGALYEGTGSVKFLIQYKGMNAEATVNGDGTDGWMSYAVITAPDGYTISSTQKEEYTKSFLYRKQTDINGVSLTYYMKEDATGYISDAKTTSTIKIDTIAPDFSGENDGMTIKENVYKGILNIITFGIYTQIVDGTIAASDDLSGVNKYYYYAEPVSEEEKADYQPYTADALDVRTNLFREAKNGKFTLDADGSYVVYAYAVDKAGNRSSYICSDGLVRDTTNPDMNVTLPKKEDNTLKAKEATLRVTMEEDATLLYFYVSEGEFPQGNKAKYEAYVNAVRSYMNDSNPQYPQFVKEENGKKIPVVPDGETSKDVTIAQAGENVSNPQKTVYRMEVKRGVNELRIADGLEPCKACTIWLATIDKAGNMSTSELEFTTTKAQPQIDTLPMISGFYGDTPKDLTVTKSGVARYEGDIIDGKWEITDTGNTPLLLGTTASCQVTFTPDVEKYGDIYEAVVENVVPIIKKRPLTIYIADLSREYKAAMPSILFEADGVAACDNLETIAGMLTLLTEANADSDAGDYDFTVSSDSKNYEVSIKYCADLTDKTGTEKANGTLSIKKTQGEIIKDSTVFKDIREVQYQYGNDYATFRLGVSAKPANASLKYEITNAKRADGKEVEPEKLLAIAEDGIVSIKGAGSATITISLPETKNYLAANSLTVEVHIAKDKVTIPSFERSYIYTSAGIDAYDMISENNLYEERFGAIIYGDGGYGRIPGMEVSMDGELVTSEEALEQFFDGYQGVPYVDTNSSGRNSIQYTVKKQDTYQPREVTVTIPVTSENCTINENDTVVFHLRNVDQKTVVPSSIKLIKDTMTYGETLSVIGFQNAVFLDAADGHTQVPGILEWKDSTVMPEAGEYLAEYIFRPYDKNRPYIQKDYKEYSGSIKITVNKAVPIIVSVPVPGEWIYRPSGFSDTILNDGGAKSPGIVNGIDGKKLSGEWKFKNPEKQAVGNNTYTVSFVPLENGANEKNYTSIEQTITVMVKKATPYISQSPSGAEYTHGDYLYNRELNAGKAVYGNGRGEAGIAGTEMNVEIPGTFIWKNASGKLSYMENNGMSYEYLFLPEDTTSYETVSGQIAVIVKQAEYPPYLPGSSMSVASTCKTFEDITLPQGWEWKEKDQSLVDGMNQGTAIYTASDKGNYKNTETEISVQRSHCAHAKTEIRNVQKATCVAEGNTGKTWCLICNEEVNYGYQIPKDATNHTGLHTTVIRQATTALEGFVKYECSACGYSEMKMIPKLPSGNSNNGQQNAGEDSSTGNTTENGQGTPAKPESIKPQPPVPTKQPDKKEHATASGEQSGKKDPFIKGEDGKEGWDYIKSETEGAQEGETILVDMNGTTLVPGGIFDSIRGKDVNIVFDMGGGILWTVKGMEITAQNIRDIDFGVTMGGKAGKTIPIEVINKVTGERYFMNLTLAYEGEFGFTATLTINMDAANAGLYANLFYYHPEKDKLEFICAGRIAEDGNTELTFTHASDYTIVIDTQPMDRLEESISGGEQIGEKASDKETEQQMETPEEVSELSDKDTGNNWLAVCIIGILIVAGVGVLWVFQKKRKNNL